MRSKLFTPILVLAVSSGLAAFLPGTAPAGEIPVTSTYKVLPPIGHGNLTIFPVVAASAHDTQQFLTLDEGLRSGDVVVSESGNVAPLVRPRHGFRPPQYNPRDGYASSANLYLEHFPYINRLWFGEYFDYDSRPDYWLVEISGIPFGLMGEMLEKGGNPWRGMTMGMTARLPWAGDPTPLWKVWDDFGIQQSSMHGWWSGADPVKTSDADVLATTWTKPGSAMIALGSWRSDDARVKLTIDWKALGMDPTTTRIRAPSIEKFQTAGNYAPGDDISIPGGRGIILILEHR